ncbi:hypothetical protein TNCV_1102101 [Trichonephila clavipes]|nr:hypothetical protein TNCV_1102101 [Trichonephila clavipes]
MGLKSREDPDPCPPLSLFAPLTLGDSNSLKKFGVARIQEMSAHSCIRALTHSIYKAEIIENTTLCEITKTMKSVLSAVTRPAITAATCFSIERKNFWMSCCSMKTTHVASKLCQS